MGGWIKQISDFVEKELNKMFDWGEYTLADYEYSEGRLELRITWWESLDFQNFQESQLIKLCDIVSKEYNCECDYDMNEIQKDRNLRCNWCYFDLIIKINPEMATGVDFNLLESLDKDNMFDIYKGRGIIDLFLNTIKEVYDGDVKCEPFQITMLNRDLRLKFKIITEVDDWLDASKLEVMIMSHLQKSGLEKLLWDVYEIKWKQNYNAHEISINPNGKGFSIRIHISLSIPDEYLSSDDFNLFEKFVSIFNPVTPDIIRKIGDYIDKFNWSIGYVGSGNWGSFNNIQYEVNDDIITYAIRNRKISDITPIRWFEDNIILVKKKIKRLFNCNDITYELVEKQLPELEDKLIDIYIHIDMSGGILTGYEFNLLETANMNTLIEQRPDIYDKIQRMLTARFINSHWLENMEPTKQEIIRKLKTDICEYLEKKGGWGFPDAYGLYEDDKFVLKFYLDIKTEDARERIEALNYDEVETEIKEKFPVELLTLYYENTFIYLEVAITDDVMTGIEYNIFENKLIGKYRKEDVDKLAKFVADNAIDILAEIGYTASYSKYGEIYTFINPYIFVELKFPLWEFPNNMISKKYTRQSIDISTIQKLLDEKLIYGTFVYMNFYELKNELIIKVRLTDDVLLPIEYNLI
jgi:DNA-directed RNA polymerase subunit RPC12/RpoP